MITHTQLTITDCGTLSTIISGRYFSLNTPPTGCHPSTCVDSKSLWNRKNSLLRPVASTSVTHTVGNFSTSFTEKVDTIRANTAAAPAPMIEHRQVPPLASFKNFTVEEVSQILWKTPNKQCELDPMPTWLVKERCDVLPTNHHIHGECVFHTGLFPDSHKHVVVRTRIKKPSLDPLEYHVIQTNLSLFSKQFERLVVKPNVHVNQYGLFPARQSAYWQHHSTETAITIVHNDVVHTTDVGFVPVGLPWCCWISAQHSTLLITAYCWRYSPNDSVSRTLNWTGSVFITPDACRLSQLPAATRLQLRLHVAFLKFR